MDLIKAKNKKGETRFRFKMEESEFRSYAENYAGFCVRCGDEACQVEPDARGYECEGCEEKGVYGTEELLMMGYIDLDIKDEGVEIEKVGDKTNE